jgi:hypothetical protein
MVRDGLLDLRHMFIQGSHGSLRYCCHRCGRILAEPAFTGSVDVELARHSKAGRLRTRHASISNLSQGLTGVASQFDLNPISRRLISYHISVCNSRMSDEDWDSQSGSRGSRLLIIRLLHINCRQTKRKPRGGQVVLRAASPDCPLSVTGHASGLGLVAFVFLHRSKQFPTTVSVIARISCI